MTLHYQITVSVPCGQSRARSDKQLAEVLSCEHAHNVRRTRVRTEPQRLPADDLF